MGNKEQELTPKTLEKKICRKTYTEGFRVGNTIRDAKELFVWKANEMKETDTRMVFPMHTDAITTVYFMKPTYKIAM